MRQPRGDQDLISTAAALFALPLRGNTHPPAALICVTAVTVGAALTTKWWTRNQTKKNGGDGDLAGEIHESSVSIAEDGGASSRVVKQQQHHHAAEVVCVEEKRGRKRDEGDTTPTSTLELHDRSWSSTDDEDAALDDDDYDHDHDGGKNDQKVVAMEEVENVNVESTASVARQQRRREGARRRSESGISPPVSSASPREPTIVEADDELLLLNPSPSPPTRRHVMLDSDDEKQTPGLLSSSQRRLDRLFDAVVPAAAPDEKVFKMKPDAEDDADAPAARAPRTRLGNITNTVRGVVADGR